MVINYLFKARNVFLILCDIIFSSIPFHIWNEFDNGFMSNKITTENKQRGREDNASMEFLFDTMMISILEVTTEMREDGISENKIKKVILRDVEKLLDVTRKNHE